MKLYHVTENLLHDGHFVPKVPKSRLEHENDSVSRVCFSKTIKGCLSAMPNGGAELEKMLGVKNGVLKVFVIDTKNFPKEVLIKPKSLVSQSLVPDAVLTGEHWIMKEFIVEESFLVQIHDYRMKKVNAKIRWKGKTVYFQSPKSISFLIT